MTVETARGLFDDECGCLNSEPLDPDSRKNALWGKDYMFWFFRKPEEDEIERLIDEMIMLWELDT